LALERNREMTEADPSDGGGHRQRCHSVLHGRKQSFHTRVKQQGLLVAHEQLIKLEIPLRNIMSRCDKYRGRFRLFGSSLFPYIFFTEQCMKLHDTVHDANLYNDRNYLSIF
jgi:hypothetical protein